MSFTSADAYGDGSMQPLYRLFRFIPSLGADMVELLWPLIFRFYLIKELIRFKVFPVFRPPFWISDFRLDLVTFDVGPLESVKVDLVVDIAILSNL